MTNRNEWEEYYNQPENFSNMFRDYARIRDRQYDRITKSDIAQMSVIANRINTILSA